MGKTLSTYALNLRYACRWRKPRLLARLARTFAGIILRGRQPLRYVDFAVGYDCNLHCAHCFATALRRDGRAVLTPAEYGRVADEAMALGAVNFSFQGGEPTLYPQLFDYIRHARPDRNLISVTTNGTTLDDARLTALRDAGVDILTISLDSGIAAEHDRFRGVPGTFDLVTGNIARARQLGLQVTLGAVVSPQTLRSEGLARLIALAHRLRVILFLALAAPRGKWTGASALLLTAADRAVLDALLLRWPFLRTDFYANFVHRGCGAVKEILYLTPYGDVLACPFLHFSLGNVRAEPLAAIRARALAYPFFARYHQQCLAAEDTAFLARLPAGFYADGDTPHALKQLFAGDAPATGP